MKVLSNVSYFMDVFPRVAVTNYHKFNSLKQQELIPSLFEGQGSEIKLPAELHSLEKLQGATLPCLFHPWWLQPFSCIVWALLWSLLP